jgi:hypothetical protein
MRRIACSLALLLAVAAVATAADPIVTLTVNERAGVARVGEPVTGGFPLPKGLVLDIGELTLSDASGKPLAAQFDLLDRWPDDNSVRWALLNTAVSVPAKGSAKLNVTRGKGGASSASP